MGNAIMFCTYAFTTSDIFPYLLIMTFLARSYPSSSSYPLFKHDKKFKAKCLWGRVKYRIFINSKLPLTFGSTRSFKSLHLSISASKMFQKGSQSVWEPLNLVIINLGSFLCCASLVLTSLPFAAWFFLHSFIFNSNWIFFLSCVRSNSSCSSRSFVLRIFSNSLAWWTSALT